MPSRKPPTVRTRDQLVAFDTSSDEGKQRMVAEIGRVVADLGVRVARIEATLAAGVEVTGSRGGNAALQSLLTALGDLIVDETTA